MANFTPAYLYVKPKEGGWSNNPVDRGGPTNYGITLTALKACGLEFDVDKNGFIDVNDLKDLTPDEAEVFFKQRFWLPVYEQITSQAVATYIFDMSVNLGPNASHGLLQRGICCLAGNRLAVLQDGLMGPKTLELTNRFTLALLPVLRAVREGYYRAIVAGHPEQKIFLDGWLNRTYGAIL